MVLPDFIIAGAMKCGTTTLHHILAHHPDIFIPEGEVNFYDIDNILQHYNFFAHNNGKWYWPDIHREKDKHLNWYNNFFEGASEGQVVGEDSTTYIASDIAPRRIMEINPDAKIILMLRDPASRCYSHYYHAFRMGRVAKSFEKSIIYESEPIMQRSMYKQQVENFLKFIPLKNLKIIVFEEFIKDIEKIIDELLEFIEVDKNKLSLTKIDTHKNKTALPAIFRLQLFKNRILKNITTSGAYVGALPNSTTMSLFDKTKFKSVNKIHELINPKVDKEKPKMKKETRIFLNEYFQNINKGLNGLCGYEVDKLWYK